MSLVVTTFWLVSCGKGTAGFFLFFFQFLVIEILGFVKQRGEESIMEFRTLHLIFWLLEDHMGLKQSLIDCIFN